MMFIETVNAPKAIGAYSQGVKKGNMVFTSGQLPIDPASGELISGDIVRAVKVSLENVLAIVEEAGGKKTDIVKVTVFVSDISKFPQINEEYGKFFGEHKPARSLVEVAKLPKGGEIEIEAVAVI